MVHLKSHNQYEAIWGVLWNLEALTEFPSSAPALFSTHEGMIPLCPERGKQTIVH